MHPPPIAALPILCTGKNQEHILLPKLAVLDEEIAQRQQVAARYAALHPLPLGEGGGEGCWFDLRLVAHQVKLASNPLNTCGRCYKK